MKYEFKNIVADTRPSQAYIVQGKVYLEMQIFFTKNEVHCLKSLVKHINKNTNTRKNPDGDVCGNCNIAYHG